MGERERAREREREIENEKERERERERSKERKRERDFAVQHPGKSKFSRISTYIYIHISKLTF